MHLLLVIHSVICVVGIPAGVFFAGASIISIANMRVPWVQWLVAAAFLVPVMFALSVIGAWVAYHHGHAWIMIGFFALPWSYGAAFVAAMLVSFK